MIGGQKVTIVCGAMNRTEHLRVACSSWLQRPEVDEIVIVDWSSEPLVAIQDKIVMRVRVLGQKYWCLSKCYNLALSMVTEGLVLRLDADDCLNPDFFDKHPFGQPLTTKEFYCLDIMTIKNDNEGCLMGVVYAPIELFKEVNGYNERLVLYGHDDHDLRERMRAIATQRNLNGASLFHQPHSADVRQIHERPATAEELAVPKGTSWQTTFIKTARSAEINSHLAKIRPWSKQDLQTRWVVRASNVDARWIICSEETRSSIGNK